MSATDVAHRSLLVISHRPADMALMHEVHAMHHGLVTQIQPSNSG